MGTTHLVSCVSKKQNSAQPARELYVSAWFLKARAYAEAHGERWFVLSAEHGLLRPDDVIHPYEKTLNRRLGNCIAASLFHIHARPRAAGVFASLGP